MDGYYVSCTQLNNKGAVIIWFHIWEKGTNVLGKQKKSWLPADECLHSRYGKVYIFGKRRMSPFQKYTVFHGYLEGIHGAAAWISLILPRFPCTLVPFSLIRNHLWVGGGCLVFENRAHQNFAPPLTARTRILPPLEVRAPMPPLTNHIMMYTMGLSKDTFL